MAYANLARGLSLDRQHQIWVGGETAALSYPPDGHARNFQMEERSFWFRHRNEFIISALRRFPPPGALLDVGGGNGYVTRRILDEGFDATLLEPAVIGALNGKRHRALPEVICATLEQCDFPPDSLSAVGCFDVIEHIEDDHDFVERIHRALRPGGRLYATLPTHPWLWSFADVGGGHHRRYTERSVRELFDVRFHRLYFTYFFGILTVPILLFRSLPFRLGLANTSAPPSRPAEHGVGGGWKLGILGYFLRRELAALQEGKCRRTGSSCLLVAQKMAPA